MTTRGRVFFMLTFGCKVNQYETQDLREAWTADGGIETDDASQADLILVNSCAVTATAVSDLRQALRRLHRESPHAAIILTGCAAAREARTDDNDTLSSLPGVTLLADPRHKAELLSLFSGTFNAAQEDLTAPRTSVAYPPFRISGFKRSRPVLKVQDGCSQRCTYCIVPLTRGPSRSRSVAEIVAEARRLLESGYAEIMISGINLRQYARHAEGCPDFWSLLRHLDKELASEWVGHARLRLSSVEPGQLDAHGLETLASSRLVCPHLHISLQSGSGSVLSRMGRGHYGPEDLLRATEQLREIWPTFGLGADILTGFPGETAQEAEETRALVQAIPLTYAHVFPYSERPGTKAVSMPLPVPVPERKRRAAALRGIVAAKKKAFLESLVGGESLMALETPENGHNEWYAPCTLSEPMPSFSHRLLNVRALRAEKGMLVVAPCD